MKRKYEARKYLMLFLVLLASVLAVSATALADTEVDIVVTNTSCTCHIRECPVSVIFVQLIRELTSKPSTTIVVDSFYPRSINEIKVYMSVIVVIKESGTGSGAFNNVS